MTNNRMENIRKKAVALRYQPQEMEAPTVIAKGQGVMAKKIIEVASEQGVPLQEDPALVVVLSQIELNEQIPAELYQLVAEVLSLVYRVDQLAAPGNKGQLP